MPSSWELEVESWSIDAKGFDREESCSDSGAIVIIVLFLLNSKPKPSTRLCQSLMFPWSGGVSRLQHALCSIFASLLSIIIREYVKESFLES